MRKYRPFADGLANWEFRPIADLPDHLLTGGEPQKAAVGSTEAVRQQQRISPPLRRNEQSLPPATARIVPEDQMPESAQLTAPVSTRLAAQTAS
jgi:hypothetical protein